MKKSNKLKLKRNYILGVCILIALLGSFLVYISSAATFSIGLEAESDSATTANKISDNTASGGSAILFKNTSTNNDNIKPLTPGTTWDWQIGLASITTVNLDKSSNPKKMMDLDPYAITNPASTITSLKNKNIVVICYFSAGSYEPGRSDSADLAPYKLNAVDDWPGEFWLNIKNPTNVGSGATKSLQTIMGSRMDQAKSWGCDGIEPDNIDGYDENIGSQYNVTANDQIIYNRMLASLAHSRKMSIGLKNDIAQINQLVNDFDWALNEQCYQYSECEDYSYFINANKAVFNAEYKSCPNSSKKVAGLDSILFALALDNKKYTIC